MRYSELMLLESDVVGYVIEGSIMNDANIIEEARKPSDVSKEVDRLFKKKKDYLHTSVFDDSERNVKRKSDRVESDKTKYEVSKLINKLSTLITGLGTGTALVGKLSDSKTVTMLGAAVTISGLISKVVYSKKTVEKNANKYESSLLALYIKLEDLQDDLDKADDDLIEFQRTNTLSRIDTKTSLKRSRHRREAIAQIKKIQSNINNALDKLNNERGTDFSYDD